jgi:hypothetical protein
MLRAAKDTRVLGFRITALCGKDFREATDNTPGLRVCI